MTYNYLAVAKQINRIELYSQAAAQLNVAVPADEMCSSRLMDGMAWDGKDPQGYAAGFAVHVRFAAHEACKELDLS